MEIVFPPSDASLGDSVWFGVFDVKNHLIVRGKIPLAGRGVAAGLACLFDGFREMQAAADEPDDFERDHRRHQEGKPPTRVFSPRDVPEGAG